MKKIATALMAFSAFLFAGGDIVPVQEEVVVVPTKNLYIGGSVQATTITVDTTTVDFASLSNTGYGVGIQGGWIFLRSGDFSTAIEGRYAYTWQDDSLGDTQVISGFVKPEYNFGSLAVYGLVGYAYIDTKDIGSYDGFTWGIGAEVPLDESFAVFIDYTNTPNVDNGTSIGSGDFDYDVISVGLNYKF